MTDDDERERTAAADALAERAEGRRQADHTAAAVIRAINLKNAAVLLGVVITLSGVIGAGFARLGGRFIWPDENVVEQVRPLGDSLSRVNSRVDTLALEILDLRREVQRRGSQTDTALNYLRGLAFFRCTDPAMSERELRLSGLPCAEVVNGRR